MYFNLKSNILKGAKLMYRIFINTQWCKCCGLCADNCPKKVYDYNAATVPVPARIAECNGCRMCELKCPDMAIKVEVVK